jgi:hypothetical protein
MTLPETRTKIKTKTETKKGTRTHVQTQPRVPVASYYPFFLLYIFQSEREFTKTELKSINSIPIHNYGDLETFGDVAIK